MVLLQLTSSLSLRLLALSASLPPDLASELAPYVTHATGHSLVKGKAKELETISHELLVKVSRSFRDQRLERRDLPTLAELLRLTNIFAPPPPVREKSPELLAILASIKEAQDRAEYASMTSLKPLTTTPLFTIRDTSDTTGYAGSQKSEAEEWTEIRKQVGAIVNVGASMAAVGTAVWWFGGGRSVAARLGLSLSGAMTIGMIEAFLYWRFFRWQSERGQRQIQVLALDRRKTSREVKRE